jgi:regulator of protease activity HflC (stomatin/prohibitin superfamily)
MEREMSSEMNQRASREREGSAVSGWVMVVVLPVIVLTAVAGFVMAVRAGEGGWAVAAAVWFVLAIFGHIGLTVVSPNRAMVMTVMGTYSGTLKQPGFWWVNPITSRKSISLRVRNFESDKLKVNDSDGNPIEIAAVVVWRIVETYEAVFNVDNYENFVHVQSESAVRVLATTYPYDAHEEGKTSLRHSVGEVTDRMRHEVQERLSRAGIEVIEARITHLAYAPEIAGAMLRRQQASAVIAARQKIVEGAVGMVEMALNELSRKRVVELDEERKAAMVSNLLVVLCSDRGVEPVVNAGTLYT